MAEKHAPAGVLIVFEGIDGCGKSTQATLLAERLEEREEAVLLVREPGTTAVAEAVREILLHRTEHPLTPESELFLYLAARADLYDHVILPALAAGTTVVSDRCFWSTIAYQGAGLNLGVDVTRELSLIATKKREPDLVVLLDLPPEEAAARRRGPADRIERRGEEYLACVRAAFLTLAERSPATTLLLDAAADIDEIHATVLARVEPLLGARR